jgi:4-hydroxybenzoate polyprenyltransferase
MAETHDTGNSRSVIFVDLDGTLIATDTLCEAVLLSFRQCPVSCWRAPWALFRGLAQFKRCLAELVTPDAEVLPYRQEVLEFLRIQKQQGAKLVLATATDQRWADAVAMHLNLFDDVIASDGRTNVKGEAKLAAMEHYCSLHGFEEFAYVGDSSADVPIWRKAAQVYVVQPTAGLLRTLKGFCQPSRVFGGKPGRIGPLFRALRPQHWTKNLFLFVPLAMAHDLLNPEKFIAAVTAFIAFCASASAVYFLNDAQDLEVDRRHPEKCRRPLASGALPIYYAPVWTVLLATVGILLSAWTLQPLSFAGLLVLYLLTNVLYSMWLKRKTMIDVLVLAGLYTARILAGGFATDTPVSQWLIGFSVFFFTSLAFAKRYAELVRLADEGQEAPGGRGYAVTDQSLIESMGSTSGYLSVLVLALYINGEVVKELYTYDWLLWLVCPLLLYWISRIWLKAKRRRLTEDPVVFALRDPASWIVGVVTVILLICATAPWVKETL